MIENPIACEAVKISYKQTKEGNIVTFRLHPSDQDKHIADMPLGTMVMLGVAKIDEAS